MATTTNYGWTTPDDTALVKDGASAIRSLGTSVDTTTKNLNPQTTTGAIAYRSSTSNVNTSLPIGTAGQVLTVNSGATAPEWATPTPGGATLISTTTFNGTPTTTLSSIPATYNDLRIVMRLPLPATDGTDLLLRINSDSNTRYRTLLSSQANAAFTFAATSISLNELIDNTVTQGLVVIDIPDYANTSTWKQVRSVAALNDSTTTTSLRWWNIVGFYNQTAAISSLSFFHTSGNATSGTILLYGVK